MKRLIHPLLALLFMAAPAQLFAAASNWEVLPAVHTVRALIRTGDELWGATNSGLFRFDLETQEFHVFTTVDGLSSMDIQAMVADNRGNLILGMGNAYLDIFNLETYEVKRISDFKLNTKIFKIYALYSYNDSIYVGTDIGVSRLLYFEDLGQYLIEGNYITLGNFTTETKAQAITVFEGGLWVGTEAGLARGDLSAAVLESPTSWTNYTTAQGLSSNDVSALEIFRDTLYVATPSTGLNRLIGDSFEPLSVSYSSGITFLKAYHELLYQEPDTVSLDTLYFGRSYGIYRLEGNQGIQYGPNENKGLCIEFGVDGSLWAGAQTGSVSGYGTKLGGLKRYSGSDNEWVLYSPDGPIVETVNDVLVGRDGSVWVTGRPEIGYTNGGLSHFDGSRWVNWGRFFDNYGDLEPASPDSFFWYWTRLMTEDNEGGVWVANDGRGVGWFDFEEDTVLAKGYYSSPSGYLFNIAGTTQHYCVVRDLLTDSQGNIWICNSEANPTLGQPIAIVPAAFVSNPEANPEWHYLTVKNDDGNVIPYAEFYVDRIAQDSYGRKWFGGNNNTGEDKGVYVLDDNGTPFDDTDDLWTHITNLPSDSITAIVCDRDGIVWVGTPAGVQYFYPEPDPQNLYGIDLPYIPVGSSVSTIAVDPQNNKWFGTKTGVCALASDNYTWLEDFRFTSLDGAYPSPLPGDVVQAVAFNSETGDAYLGTDKGLARLATPFKQMGPKVAYVQITKSNPFIIPADPTEWLSFASGGLSETVEMKILTAAGFLVRHLQKNEIELGWDGRNSRGELVGSGVYLILAYDAAGNTATGKVAVIHR